MDMVVPMPQPTTPGPTFASTSLTRLTNVGRGGNVPGQLAYEIDALPEEPTRFGMAGVTEVLAFDEDQLLVTERATVEDANGISGTSTRSAKGMSPPRRMFP